MLVWMSALLTLVIFSLLVVCVTIEEYLVIKIPYLGLLYDFIIYVWIVHCLSFIVGVGMGAPLGTHVIRR